MADVSVIKEGCVLVKKKRGQETVWLPKYCVLHRKTELRGSYLELVGKPDISNDVAIDIVNIKINEDQTSGRECVLVEVIAKKRSYLLQPEQDDILDWLFKLITAYEGTSESVNETRVPDDHDTKFLKMITSSEQEMHFDVEVMDTDLAKRRGVTGKVILKVCKEKFHITRPNQGPAVSFRFSWIQMIRRKDVRISICSFGEELCILCGNAMDQVIYYIMKILIHRNRDDRNNKKELTAGNVGNSLNSMGRDNNVESFAWFHGSISRENASQLLQKKPGQSFLVRRSESFPSELVLSLASNGLKHYRISADRGKYQIVGESPIFDSLNQLVMETCDGYSPINKDDNIEDLPWFHGYISRIKTEEILADQPEGTFLVRKSLSSPGQYSLSFACNGIRHFRIFTTQGKYNIGDYEYSFDTLKQLVMHYRENMQEAQFSDGSVWKWKLAMPLNKVRDTDTQADEAIPVELGDDPYARELYEVVLKEGTEIDNTIRIMVVGCYGQGKTSLVRRLLNETTEGVKTTDGIEVHKCVALNNTEWTKENVLDSDTEGIQRLVNIVKRSSQDVSGYETESEMLQIKFENYERSQSNIEGDSETADEHHTLPNKLPSNVTGHLDDQGGEKPGEKIQSNEGSMDRCKPLEPVNMCVDLQNLRRFKTELIKHESNDSSGDMSSTVRIWDFAGQSVYYATHQIFHSPQAVYILVFSLANDLDTIIKDDEFPMQKKTLRDFLKFWVSSIDSYVGSVDGCEPPIILVGTNMDRLKTGENTEAYFEDIRQMFDGRLCLNHIQPKHFAISNTDPSDTGIEELRKAILHMKRNQNDRLLPAKWIPLEKALKSHSKNIITFDDVLEIDRKTEYPIQSNEQNKAYDQIKLFLSYQHAIGAIIYFDVGELAKYVVLRPEFIIEAFKSIVSSEQFCKVRPKMRNYWKKLCCSAVLDPKLLEEVWTQSHNKDFIKYKDILVEFLKKHRIISDVSEYDEDTKSIQPVGYYIVPSFLKKSANDDRLEELCTGKRLSHMALGFILENESSLPILYQQCLGAFVSRWPLVKFDGEFFVYDDKVAVQLNHDHAGVLMLKENRLELLVVNLCPPDVVSAENCDMLRRYTELVINIEMRTKRDETRRFIKKLVMRCFHNDHGFKGSEEVCDVEELKSKITRRFPCPDKKSHCCRAEDIIHEWFLSEIVPDNVPKRHLTHKEYNTLSMAIGKDWQHIGIQLGLTTIEIEHVEMDNRTVSMQIYNMFITWDEKMGDEARLDVLVAAISKCPSVKVNWNVVRNLMDDF